MYPRKETEPSLKRQIFYQFYYFIIARTNTHFFFAEFQNDSIDISNAESFYQD
jgi:hypothetical protein